MSLPYNEAAFYKEGCIQRWVDYPFWNVGERTAKTYTYEYMVNRDYRELLPLDTPCPDNAAALLVEETPPSPGTGGLQTYQRTYATVPAPWSEAQVFAWEIPGVDIPTGLPLAFNSAKVMTVTGAQAQAVNRTNKADALVVVLSADTSLPVGTGIYMHLSWSATTIVTGKRVGAVGSQSGRINMIVPILHKGGDNRTLTFRSPVAADSQTYSGSTRISYDSTITLGWLGRMVNRKTKTQLVTARITHSYFHSKDPWASWRPEQPFTIYDDEGAVTDTLTTTSVPTYDQYEAMRSAEGGTWVLAAQPLLQRWRGNIWEVLRTEVKVL